MIALSAWALMPVASPLLAVTTIRPAAELVTLTSPNPLL